MLTITLEPELENTLKTMAEQQHISVSEMVKRLIKLSLKKQKSDLLIDKVNTLAQIECFQNQDPLALQQALRDEWN